MNKKALSVILLSLSLGSVSAFAATNHQNTQKLNINAATVKQLDNLPHIGNAIAGRIVKYREVNKGFKSVDELAKVRGLSSQRVKLLAPMITVGK